MEGGGATGGQEARAALAGLVPLCFQGLVMRKG